MCDPQNKFSTSVRDSLGQRAEKSCKHLGIFNNFDQGGIVPLQMHSKYTETLQGSNLPPPPDGNRVEFTPRQDSALLKQRQILKSCNVQRITKNHLVASTQFSKGGFTR